MTNEKIVADMDALASELWSNNDVTPHFVRFETNLIRRLFGYRLMPIRKRPKRLAKKVAKRGAWDTTMCTARAKRRMG